MNSASSTHEAVEACGFSVGTQAEKKKSEKMGHWGTLFEKFLILEMFLCAT